MKSPYDEAVTQGMVAFLKTAMAGGLSEHTASVIASAVNTAADKNYFTIALYNAGLAHDDASMQTGRD